MIAIIDYGAGNLRSILRAIESEGGQATITGNPDEIIRADRVVLPGVGNAKAAMEQLISTGIADAVKEQAERGTPLLGVCLGMQLLFGEQEEGPTTGLSLIPGKGVKLSGDHKIPHMGWNTVRFTDHSLLLDDRRAPTTSFTVMWWYRMIRPPSLASPNTVRSSPVW
ncbi:MAG: imidazole glycerol phosphate synthase subunit HisH [Thermomicrobiales bacterium]|nr:imidazole glycerol phosphate synthase subunit HisH [Thermomicrobiales bacterium]